MTRLGLFAVLCTLAVAATGCETPPPATCSPTNCLGCCNASGECVGGVSLNACGISGAVCTDCTAIGQCVAGGRCEANAGGGAGGGTGGGATGGGTGGGVTGGGTGGGVTGGGTGGGVTGGGGGDTGGGAGGGVTGGGTGGGVTGGGTGGGVTGGGTGGGVTGGGTGGGVTGGGTGGGSGAVGDACDAPIDIVLANGVGAAVGDRTSSADDATGSCGGQGGSDIVFRFTTASVGTLTIDVRPNDAQQQVSAYLRSACDQAATEVPGACVQAQSAGGGTLLVQRNLTAGTYYLWVDGAGAATGAVNVSLNFSNDAGDVCASPIPLPFSSGEANAAGSTAGAINDGTSTCGGTGADVIYRFEVSTPSNFDVTVSPRNVNVTPVVHLRSSLCTGPQVGCNAATAAGNSALLRLGSLPIGTYYLWVDAATANSGDYSLTAHLVPPIPGETCANARALSFSNGPAGGTASDLNDTTPTFADSAGTCAAGTGGDLVYTFTTNTALDFSATASTTSGTYRPALYLRASTCTGAERTCNAATLAGGSATLTQGSLPAGTWFLWVDGAANTAGPYALSASLTPPAIGDTCANPEPLVFTGGSAADTGDTSMLFHESSGTCATGTGGDAVYTFTTTSVLDLRANASTTSSTYRPALYLRNSTCTGTERTCNAATVAGGTSALTVGALPAGTYFMFVDGAAGTSGPYALSATLTPPALGEGCANPKPLAFSGGPAGGTATDTGSTDLLFNDTAGTCATGTGNDAVYSFTTNAPLDLRVDATTGSATFRPALYLRNGTCTGTERTCNAATIAGGSASLVVGSLPAGTYFLFIDGAAGTSGPFSLTATAVPPALGDTCANPEPLVFSNGAAGGTASDTGDTSPLFHETVGTCAPGTSRDAVYSFTTNTPLDLRIDASTTSSTYRPALYLRNTNCTGTERTCGIAAVAGGTASLTVGSLPAGTYYVFVDGVGGTTGPYALSATASAPILGDTCANPVPLVFTNGAAGGTASDTGDTTLLFGEQNGSCITGTGRDAVYSFTTNTALDLRVNASTSSSTYQPTLYLRNTSCTGVERACNAATLAGGTAALAVGGLPAGTYFLFVDGAASTNGAYALSASLTAPALGEGCGNPKPLVFTSGAASDTGDTALNFNDLATSCATGTAPDTVYSFTTTATLDFSATVSTTTGTFRPVLSLRNATCTGAERTCNAATVSGGSATVDVQALPAGTYFLWVDGVAGTSGTYSLSATSAPAPAEEVRARAVTNVLAPGPMSVTFEVVDRYGNVITTDSTVSFTVNVTGAALFGTATQGAILSGAGTNSVLVRVTNGVVTLTVSDATQETVTFTAVDSQMNGLRYPGTTFTQTAPTQLAPCGGVARLFTFNTPSTPTGPGTVTVVGRGDFSAATTTEYLDVFMESVSGTNLGRVFAGTSSQCGTVDSTANVSVPLTTLQAALADGTATVALNPGSGVNCGLCTATSDLARVTLSFPMTITGTFL